MMDDGLLTRLDADEEVREQGRSAVLRRALAEYLDRRRRRRITDAYRHAYAHAKALPEEWSGWAEEGVWPDE